MELDVPSAWLDLRREAPGLILVLGDCDSGKSTFGRWLAAELGGWFVDADPGQPDLGIPGCMACAPAGEPARHLWFVGSKSPGGFLVPCLVGCLRLVSAARRSGARHLVVNTDGWISGGEAPAWKRALLNALEPDLVVALGPGLGPLLGPYRKVLRIVDLPVSGLVRRRTRPERAARRQALFSGWFREAVPQALTLGAQLERVAPGTLLGLFGEGNECLGVGLLQDFPRVLAAPGLAPRVRRVVAGRLRLDREFRDGD